MANTITRFGDSGPEWGLTAETTGYAQDFSCKAVSEKATCEDETGQTITVVYFNKKWEGSLTMVAKTSATLPSYLTNVTIANVSSYEGADKVVIYESEKKPEQKGFTKYTYTFESYSNVTY